MMFHTVCPQGNENKHSSERPLHACPRGRNPDADAARRRTSGATGSLGHCRWGREMAQPLRKTFLAKQSVILLCNSTTGKYSTVFTQRSQKRTFTQKTCIQMLKATLLITASTRKLLRRPQWVTGRCTVVYSDGGISLSTKNVNELSSCGKTWRNL